MADNYRGNIRSNLGLLCYAYGLTQSKLAEKMGMSQAGVSKMFSNPNYGFVIEHLVKLTEVFNTDLETLVKVDLTDELKKRVTKSKD